MSFNKFSLTPLKSYVAISNDNKQAYYAAPSSPPSSNKSNTNAVRRNSSVHYQSAFRHIQVHSKRTQESRNSHKLAERKRRNEMKELFDQVKHSLPMIDSATKTSKYEILTKAIEYIHLLKKNQITIEEDIIYLKRVLLKK